MKDSAEVLAQLMGKDFVLGTATAAYQIEGGVESGGRGASIWDTFSRQPGKTHNGDTGDIACDHFNRWEKDLDLMQSLGLKAYRLSFSWSRLQPTGSGPINPEGVEFYQRLIQGCLARGIEPYVTLYHWDLPQALQDLGGWASRETAYLFGDYARQVVSHFKDMVTNWVTINEPWCVAFLGHSWGLQAPGITDETVATRVIHHVLLAHGLATVQLRLIAPNIKLGITNLLSNVNPASESDADLRAAKLLTTRLNRITLDPLYLGYYSEDVFEVFEEFGLNRIPHQDSLVKPGDLEIISTPCDFAGVNHYTNLLASEDASNQWSGVKIEHVRPTPSTFGWSNTPDGLAAVLQLVSRNYTRLPILVTENGVSLDDEVGFDGLVHDPVRVEYLSGYIQAVLAHQTEATVLGYFVWSFMDNFEWAEGYSKRFGVVYIDFPTQRRILKTSALWLKELQAAREQL